MLVKILNQSYNIEIQRFLILYLNIIGSFELKYPDRIYETTLDAVKSGNKIIKTDYVDFYQKDSFFTWHNQLDITPNLMRYYGCSCLKYIIDTWNAIVEVKVNIYSNQIMSMEDRIKTIIYKTSKMIALEYGMSTNEVSHFQLNILDFYFNPLD